MLEPDGLIRIFSRYNGAQGLHAKVTEFVRDKDCLVCGPGVLVELDTSVTLEKVISISYPCFEVFISSSLLLGLFCIVMCVQFGRGQRKAEPTVSWVSLTFTCS